VYRCRPHDRNSIVRLIVGENMYIMNIQQDCDCIPAIPIYAASCWDILGEIIPYLLVFCDYISGAIPLCKTASEHARRCKSVPIVRKSIVVTKPMSTQQFVCGEAKPKPPVR